MDTNIDKQPTHVERSALLEVLRIRMGFPPNTFALAVEPVTDWQLTAPGPMSERLARFQAALAAI